MKTLLIWRRCHRAAAVLLTLAIGWMILQPEIVPRAQQARDATQTKDLKRKKKRAKRSSNRVVLPPQIFTTVPAQQPATINTGNAVNSEKAKPLRASKPFVKPAAKISGAKYEPANRAIESFASLDFTAAAKQEALEAAQEVPGEIRPIHAPKPPPDMGSRGVPISNSTFEELANLRPKPKALTPSATGVSPPPTRSFKAEFLSGLIIPPDTIGAVGTTHIVVPSNDMMRITDRNGVELSRVTLNSFWAGTTIKGSAVTSAFDPKIYFDRFNSRFIFVVSLNGPNQFSGMGLAVTQTSNPTGSWNRYTVAADPAGTAAAGHATDYPSVGFNKNWIVVDENTFNYVSGSYTSYFGQQIFVFDKAAAYAGTLSSVSLFEGTANACNISVTPETELGCGFTMAPSVNEDNTTDNIYLLEDFDSTAGQLRMSKITGTPAAPLLTVATQFPQSSLAWRFDASRIGTSGGYAPQKDQVTFAPSTQRLITNDSRIENVVLRNGSLWTTHTVMVAATPTAAGGSFGPVNPDVRSAVQWWQIDPTIETGLSTPPIQRARLEDTTADNCHNGNGGTRGAPCNATSAQVGQFYAFPSISVNVNNDVLIGFTQFSPYTYPSGGYAFRSNSDPVNTIRDPVIFRPGQSSYNIGGGTVNTPGRQNRWGDYSATQTEPLNDTDFWVIEEYSGTRRNFGIGIAAPWETYWALVKPSTSAPSRSGNLIISEFRLRGPQGTRDEFVDLYNPAATPLIVNTTDNSDGWALAVNNGTTTTGIAVIPNGTVIRARGHLLITDDPDSDAGGTPSTTYSLPGYPNTQVRSSDGDIGWSLDIADTVGLAIFKTSNPANFSVTTVMDAAGPATLPGGSLFKEGTGFGALPTSNLEYAMVRAEDQATLTPRDTNDNATDFVFIDNAGTVESAGRRLGAPGPENIDSPLRTNLVSGSLLDASVASTASPNRIRNFTSSPPNATFGTMTIRRRLINNTGAPVTRLRFRVINMTTLPAAGGMADLRLFTSVDTLGIGVNDSATCSSTGGVPLTAPCTVTVRGTTLESPPAQSMGGGLNSTVSAGTITLAAPLATGASINIQFLLGVNQPGNYQFYVYAEFLP